MARAIQHASKVLLPNPANEGRIRYVPAADAAPVRTGRGVVVPSMMQGDLADCVRNDATGIMFKACPVVMPVSWLKELDGPVAYLRVLAAHRRRVRDEARKARDNKNLDVSVRRTKAEQRRIAHALVKSGRKKQWVPATEIVVPAAARPECVRARGHLLYEDVVLVRCRRCSADLLGSTMREVVDYLFDPAKLNRSDGQGVRKASLRRALPSVVAVTFELGHSYCPTCVPGGGK